MQWKPHGGLTQGRDIFCRLLQDPSGCCVENILNFRPCLLRLGAHSVLVPGLKKFYIIIRLHSAKIGIFLGKQ